MYLFIFPAHAESGEILKRKGEAAELTPSILMVEDGQSERQAEQLKMETGEPQGTEELCSVGSFQYLWPTHIVSSLQSCHLYQ